MQRYAVHRIFIAPRTFEPPPAKGETFDFQFLRRSDRLVLRAEAAAKFFIFLRIFAVIGEIN